MNDKAFKAFHVLNRVCSGRRHVDMDAINAFQRLRQPIMPVPVYIQDSSTTQYH